MARDSEYTNESNGRQSQSSRPRMRTAQRSGSASSNPRRTKAAKSAGSKSAASSRTSSGSTNRNRTTTAASTKRQSTSAPNARTAPKKARSKTTWSAENVDLVGALKIIGQAIASSKVAIVVIAVIAVLAVGGIADTAANWQKAYGHVSVNGIDVGGMTKDEIIQTLDSAYTAKSTSTTVTVYANEEAMNASDNEIADAERIAQAEEVSVEEADAAVTSWATNIYDLSGSLPYEEVAQQALEAGRGGPIKRLGILVFGEDVPFQVKFDDAKLDEFASGVDRTIGEPRIDATVAFEAGVAHAVEGTQGVMVDREWLAKQISDSLIGVSSSSEFIAQAVAAPSRTTLEQAQAASEGINKSIASGAEFSYEGNTWVATREDLANWTTVSIDEVDGSYEISAAIDESIAIPAVVQGVNAKVTSDNVTVSIAKYAGEIIVNTSGSGIIPEVAPAVDSLNETLYGTDGRTYSSITVLEAPKFEIENSNAPGALTFDQAVDLGILTVIGEYTTEFSNYEGTENRNHNIRTVADILNDTIVEANGGIWSYNDNSGDTTQDPPFASAGSIIAGEHVDSIGGGICQVATTIFNAVFEAGLPVVERHNHTEHMHSYPDGRDAAVSYGELDLKFENDTSSDILLKMSYTDSSVTAKLYSVYTGRTVEWSQSEWVMGDTYTTTFEESDWLYQGQYYTETAGEDGSSITVSRIVRDANGEVLIDEQYYSVYQPKKEVIVVGPGTDTKPLEHKADDDDEDEDEDSDYTW